MGERLDTMAFGSVGYPETGPVRMTYPVHDGPIAWSLGLNGMNLPIVATACAPARLPRSHPLWQWIARAALEEKGKLDG